MYQRFRTSKRYPQHPSEKAGYPQHPNEKAGWPFVL
jgi:hypothetical protein